MTRNIDLEFPEIGRPLMIVTVLDWPAYSLDLNPIENVREDSSRLR